MNIKTFFLSLFSFLLVMPLFAQIQEAPDWKVSTNKKNVRAGEEVELTFKAQVPQDWYVYSSDFDPELGPMVTEFNFIENGSFELIGEIQPIGQKKKYDDLWVGEYTYFEGMAEFQQKVRVLKENPSFQGTISYQICSDVSGQCIPFESDFNYSGLQAGGKGSQEAANAEKPTINVPQDNQKISQGELKVKGGNKKMGQKAEKLQVPVLALELFQNSFVEEEPEESGWGGLATFFLISFGAGLAALLTPCIFPMIPMTVSYFTKTGTTRAKGIMNAIIYGVSIIIIYTLIGTVFSLIFGAGFANFLSTHWIPNLFFFTIFILFALSFFGLFEITLPNKVVNKIDKQADKGGLLGTFFMAFTLVLVGFSCTGPIAGTILLQAASGEAIKPLVGMLGFSAAFAIPFTLFAIFPGWLNTLPKSGGWLNTVKVVLGFIELALALKFLSIADQVYHWGLLDREVYLALWIVIFALLGFYLLGKIHLPHEKKDESTSVVRLIMAVLVFGFVIYLVPGLLGAPLKAMAGYLPPMSTQDFNLLAANTRKKADDLPATCEKPKYTDFLHLPHGIKGYFDFEQALTCAKAENKPLFIDFTGHGCVNCREMEANVWSDPAVLKRLKEDYVVVALYVDEKFELPKKEWYVSAYDGKLKKTIGKQNLDFMIQKLNANAQPYYTLVGNNGELLAAPRSYDLNVEKFVKFLDKGIEHFERGALTEKSKL